MVYVAFLEIAKTNQKQNIRRLADFQNSLTDYVTEFITNTDKKFFLVENELAALNAIQSEMAATQD